MASAFLVVIAVLLGPQLEQDRSASLSGRVVDAISGRPIAGVVVTPAGSAVVTTAASPLPPRALTNGAGEFVVRGLHKGSVFLTAVKSGHITATYNQRRPAGAGQNLPIAEGQQLSGVVIRMWRHASISGTVVDEAGDPAVGVRVTAFRRRFLAGRRIFSAVGSASTDDRGMYRVVDLTPGDYTVGAVARQTAVPSEVMDIFFGAGGGGPEERSKVSRELNDIRSSIVPVGSPYAIAAGDQTLTLPAGTLLPQRGAQGALLIYPTVFYPTAPSMSQAGVFTVQSGEERSSIDLQVQPVRSARVSGMVMAPDGPAAHLGVRLVPAAADDAAQANEVAATMTDANGGFTFPAVPFGSHVLTVLRPPAPPVDLHETGIRVTPGGEITMGSAVGPATPPPPPPIPADATLYARVPLTVGDSAISGIVVSLSAAPRVSGRVEFEGTGDKPAPADLSRIRINLDPSDGVRLANDGLNLETGHPEQDGQFRTFGVPPGRYVLRVNPPGGWFLKGAFAGGIDISDVPFELTGKDLTGVVITFTDRPATLTGVVRNGQLIDPDALVLAFPTDSTAWRSRGAYPRRLRVGRTEQDGTFTITGLPPGEYHVVAVHEDAVADDQDPALFQSLARIARQVRIAEGERRTEDLAPVVIR